ncbi:unnamed protein product [Sphagnum jensenii]|uniref:Uncharacterized protein n=1 Tax=Sphagnum jensenii TaxID=128206 RepID=A0ABP0X0R3_9BRYO
MAYNRAAVKCRGVNVVTNFQLLATLVTLTSLHHILQFHMEEMHPLKLLHKRQSQVLLPPSSELEGMITKAYEALEGRVIRGTTTNLSKETV